MLGAILPRDGEPRSVGVAELRSMGHRYIAELGWSVFLERTGQDGQRRAIANCESCKTIGFEHDRETCECLACHGFYAATRDHERWDRMCDALPDATHLGVRTGRASGIFVVDFDVKHGGPQLHHEWRERTGLDWSFPSTRTHRTKSGGFHLLYRLPPGETVGSHNGVNGLRGVDVKGDGGLVIAPPSPGYTRVPGSDLADPGESVLRWAREARGSGYRILQTTHVIGLDILRGHESGPGSSQLITLLETETYPEGVRDDLMNALAYIFRRSGLSRERAAELIHPYWQRLEGHHSPDEFRWEWVLYKIGRIWSTVAPDPYLAAGQRWLTRVDAATQSVTPSRGEIIRVGNVTLMGRGRGDHA